MDLKQKQNILKQLARTEGDVAEKALNNEAEKIAKALQEETQYDLIADQVKLLNTIAYRVHDKAVEIIQCLLTRLETLELTYQEVLGFPVEKLREYQNNNKLSVTALETLEHIRYHHPSNILDIFFKYSMHTNEDVSQQAIHGLKALAEFDLDIFYGDGKDWKGLGWEPQEKVIEKINAFHDTAKRQYFMGIIAACNEILSPTIEGTNWSYQSITIRSGSIPAMDGIKDIRKKTLTILEDLYTLVDAIEQKKIVIDAMQSATHTPHMGHYGDDVLAMIMRDTATVLQFMKKIVAKEDLQLIQKIEHDAYFLFRRGEDEQVKEIALEVNAIIDNHAEYRIFKVLIGFQGIFNKWHSDEHETTHNDYDHEKILREQNAKEFAESITEDNYHIWKERILSYANIKSNDMATFPYFGKFLENFGRTSPKLALQLLLEASQQLENFLIPILCGIWETSEKNKARGMILDWVEKNRYMLVIARFLEFSKDLDEELLKKIYAFAKVGKDCNTLNQIISTISAQYGDNTKHLIKELFLPALEILTSHKNTNWIFSFWFRKQRNVILVDMESDGYHLILDNLFWIGNIDYHAEEILCKIAEKSPELIVQFFCNRIADEKEIEIGGKYNAIPFSFHKLSEPLSKIPEQAVDIVLSMYDGNYGMFIYRGARLLKSIFPDFSKSFECKLLQLIQTKDEKNLLFVMAILRNYEGQVFIHEVCKELVKALPNGESLLDEITVILHSTGVVCGEYGFVEAYKRKIEEIKPWLDDPDVKIQRFSHHYISILEKQISTEKQRADEDIILRKHQYGVGETE